MTDLKLKEALERIWPFFEGEHAYDHPDSVFVREVLATPSPDTVGIERVAELLEYYTRGVASVSADECRQHIAELRSLLHGGKVND